jgi:N-acetyl-anhydromuramyl-L-alanine amidase AmpD
MESKNKLPVIKELPFPKEQYYQDIFDKKIIVLHHTASGRGSDGDYRHWLSNPERVATSQIINADGSCSQLFNSKFWGHHIGCTNTNNRRLNQESIAIEIDCWGGLTWDEKDKKFISYTGAMVPESEVVEYEKSFRGFRFFQKYTPEQIESVRLLCLYWGEKYKIPLDYKADMWDISERALNATPGIWSHTSYRKDKSDIHPQDEMINMLMNLNKKV